MAQEEEITVDWRDYVSSSDDEVDDFNEERFDDGTGNIIVVDELPVVNKAKAEKLQTVITTFFSRFNTDKSFKGMFYMPFDDGADPQTLGYAFLELESKEAALTAVEKGNNFPLDKTHMLKVTHLGDFDRFSSIPNEYHRPEIPAYKPKPNLNEWALDHRGRDQFLLRFGDMTTISWFDPKTSPQIAYEKKLWTDTYAFWSPSGAYLGTFHRQGIALWGGPEFAKIMRFQHQGVTNIDFSPCEKYLVTTNRSAGDECIIVWEIRTGRKMRSFPALNDAWPAFHWSFDDLYFARLKEDGISVYKTPDMGLLDNKSIKIKGVRDFMWSPSDHLIAYWIPELNESPARVTVMKVPERTDIAKKNLFSVIDCSIHWHPQGTYLCVKAERHTKTKKSHFTNFELFRVKERNVPVELLEFKEKVLSFAWEPQGTRFAIVHGDAPRPDISFFDMGAARGKGVFQPFVTLSKRATNSVFWSPKGHVCVLANLNTGVLEFYSVDDQLTLGEAEHFMVTNVEWDPSGRFVTTYVNFRRNPSESGYIIWSWTGQLKERQMLDKLSQFAWRPHPKPMLSEEQRKNIERNLKKYIERYEPEDIALVTQQDDQVVADRARKRTEWKQYREESRKYLEQTKARRRELRGYSSDNEDDFEIIEEIREEIIDEKEEIIADAEEVDDRD